MISDEHSEIKSGELFLGNFTEKEFHRIGWDTKRMGCVAYARDGKVEQGKFPVFASEEEMAQQGVRLLR